MSSGSHSESYSVNSPCKNSPTARCTSTTNAVCACMRGCKDVDYVYRLCVRVCRLLTYVCIYVCVNV